MGRALLLTTVGVGAANSPRYSPAGLLVRWKSLRIMLDGGPGSDPGSGLAAWLVTDAHAELMPRIRRLARERGIEARMGDFDAEGLSLRWRPVVHTNHPTGGYLIRWGRARIVWAPEFWEFPAWAASASLMFAEASAWKRPIRFVRGAGGHLDLFSVAAAARAHHVRRLLFAHIGRPVLRAIDRGEKLPFGEFARDGQVFRVLDS
jgi:hypothetical protein